MRATAIKGPLSGRRGEKLFFGTSGALSAPDPTTVYNINSRKKSKKIIKIYDTKTESSSDQQEEGARQIFCLATQTENAFRTRRSGASATTEATFVDLPLFSDFKGQKGASES